MISVELLAVAPMTTIAGAVGLVEAVLAAVVPGRMTVASARRVAARAQSGAWRGSVLSGKCRCYCSPRSRALHPSRSLSRCRNPPRGRPPGPCARLSPASSPVRCSCRRSTSIAEQTYTWGEQYRTIPARYQKMIDDSELAFTKRDVEASGAALTEDFSWYTVKEDGPKEMVRGREATMARLRMFFASPMWTTNDSEVHRLGMVGNTLVQVEIDTLK